MCNDGKAASGIARTRRLDRRIQRQEVGLAGDRVDRLDDIADAGRNVLQHVDAAGSFGHTLDRAPGDVGGTLDIGPHRRVGRKRSAVADTTVRRLSAACPDAVPIEVIRSRVVDAPLRRFPAVPLISAAPLFSADDDRTDAAFQLGGLPLELPDAGLDTGGGTVDGVGSQQQRAVQPARKIRR